MDRKNFADGVLPPSVTDWLKDGRTQTRSKPNCLKTIWKPQVRLLITEGQVDENQLWNLCLTGNLRSFWNFWESEERDAAEGLLLAMTSQNCIMWPHAKLVLSTCYPHGGHMLTTRWSHVNLVVVTCKTCGALFALTHADGLILKGEDPRIDNRWLSRSQRPWKLE